MLWTALEDPDPVIVFEHGSLYNASGELADDAGPVDIDRAAVRREGSDLTIVTYGGSLAPCLAGGRDRLAGEGMSVEVIDLRTLRPLDDATVFASVARTHRALVVDEGWRSVGMSAEVAARIAEECFYDLDAPGVPRGCAARCRSRTPGTSSRPCCPTSTASSRERARW